jgi:hypothetical protein
MAFRPNAHTVPASPEAHQTQHHSLPSPRKLVIPQLSDSKSFEAWKKVSQTDFLKEPISCGEIKDCLDIREGYNLCSRLGAL